MYCSIPNELQPLTKEEKIMGWGRGGDVLKAAPWVEIRISMVS